LAQAQVVDQDDDGPMLNAELPEAAIELIQGGEARCRVGIEVVPSEQSQLAVLTSLPPGLGVAGAHQEPVGPGLQPIRIAERGQVLPCIEQRLLGGVLGERRVTQDPPRDRVHGVADAADERVEGFFVAVHRSLDELALHASPGNVRRPQSAANH
jgi:hypothetical protein